MPSPFPGMDPYLEGDEWESFHAAFMIDLGDALAPQVAPRYLVRPHRRIYVDRSIDSEGGSETIIGDSVVLRPTRTPEARGGVATLPELLPETETLPATAVEVLLPVPQTREETYLTVREAETMAVVTVIELLSPTNKRSSDGRAAYLEKREEVLQSRANLVEIDLLRGGRRLPTLSPLPSGDYVAIISRARRRPRAIAFAWTLRDRLPDLPIPLQPQDADVTLALQPVFDARYDRGNYRLSPMYRRPLEPPLNATDAAWADGLAAGLS